MLLLLKITFLQIAYVLLKLNRFEFNHNLWEIKLPDVLDELAKSSFINKIHEFPNREVPCSVNSGIGSDGIDFPPLPKNLPSPVHP